MTKKTEASEPAQDPAESPHRVLVVDDDHEITDFLTRALAQMGCSSVARHSTDQALTLLRRDARFSLIITDLVMPGACGLTFIRKLRKIRGLEKIPILLITGLMPDDLLDGIPAEFPNTYALAKPLQLERLQEIIQLK